MKTKGNKELDVLDRELLAFLYEDGRTKLTELGMQLKDVKGSKLSHVAVQKRLQKMIEEQILKIQASINISTLEYISAFILIETNQFEAQRRIIERFRLCPRIFSIDLLSGKYNIIMRAIAKNLKEMESFLNYCWLKREEGIKNIEIFISSTNIKPRYLPIPQISRKDMRLNRAPCGHRCRLCDLFKEKDCPGCPAIRFIEDEDEEKEEANKNKR